MQRLEVSVAVRPLYGSLGVKGLKQDDERAWIGLIWLMEGTCDGDQKLHPKRVKINARRLL